MFKIPGEMFKREPIFNGQSEFEQILKIFQILGHPDEDEWPGVTSLNYYNKKWPWFVFQSQKWIKHLFKFIISLRNSSCQ